MACSISRVYLAALGLGCALGTSRRLPGLLPLGRALRCGRQASFSGICSSLAPERPGSDVGAGELSCTWPCGVLVPRPGIEPESPILQGGFLPTGPAEKSHLPLNSSDGKHEQPCRCMTLELLKNFRTDFFFLLPFSCTVL